MKIPYIDDDEWLKARDESRRIAKICGSYRPQEYQNSYNRICRERRKLRNNPVACTECVIVETCVKRKQRRLTQCAYGLRQKPDWNKIQEKVAKGKLI